METSKIILSLTVAFLCFGGSAFSAIKVFPLDSLCGIVADDADWTCAIDTKGNESIGLANGRIYIKGNAKHLPISFNFFSHGIASWYLRQNHKPFYIFNNKSVFDDAKKFLANYANKTNTVFSGLSIKNSEEGDYAVIYGSYFDNTSIGRFAIYVKPYDFINTKPIDFAGYANESCYFMFIKIYGDILDDHCIKHLFQETFELITPLVID